MDLSNSSPGTFMHAASVQIDAVVARARLDLQRDGISALGDGLSALVDLDLGASDDGAALIGELTNVLTTTFRNDPYSPQAYAAIAGVAPAQAAALFDLMLQAAFGDDVPTPSVLNETGIIAFVAILSAAGAHEQAATLLAEAKAHKGKPAIQHAAWVARCRWASCSDVIADHFQTSIDRFTATRDAQAAIGEQPLDISAHRAAIRIAMAERALEIAGKALAITLSLPIGDGDKIDLAEELAVFAAVAIVRDDRGVFERPRLRWALGTSPRVASAAADTIERRIADGTIPFLTKDEGAEAAALLRGFAVPVAKGAMPAVTGYSIRNGKPHVDTVWLEITNHCNQKCTFCPDMFRENARTWLPLAQIKELIDQLADTISVGSMQLNAYGEPLLHPNIAEILSYIRERQLPFPTYFTSHGMTLVDKKLKQLSHNYPAGIAISMHNDSQESYEATRSQKIGDYETLFARVSALMKQMAEERAPSHLRLYQMVSNGNVDLRVDEITRSAFPDSVERMTAHVRKWEAVARDIAANAPPECRVHAPTNSDVDVARSYTNASHGDHDHLPILQWLDHTGVWQQAFISARPVGTYANLLLEYDPRWAVERKVLNSARCGFVQSPSLAIFATGKLGICCLDLNSTATFGSLSDFDNLNDALTSPQALRMFAQLSNGIATSKGCQICLGGSERHCESRNLPRPERPVGHFAHVV